MMITTTVSLLTFFGILLIAALIMRPVFLTYVHSYEVRVRAAKPRESSAAAPRQSQLLNLCRLAGEFTLSILPALADAKTIRLLTMANYRTPEHLAILTGIKTMVAGSTILLGISAAASDPLYLLMMCPAAVAAWIVPNFFLSTRIKKRQSKILSELPTIIDLLIVCAQAGLGLLSAIEKVSRECVDSCPILCEEFDHLLKDVKMFAKPVPHAMREMGERCGIDELTNLASALIAAEAKGSDISYPLKQQGEALRDRLKRKKEEEAGKVPVKMVPVIMTFVMPLILAPMLGPAVVTILQAIDPIIKNMK